MDQTMDSYDVSEVFRKVLLHLVMSLAVTLLGTVIGSLFIPPGAAMLLAFVALGMLIFTLFIRKKKEKLISFKFLYIFVFIEGVALYPVLQFYLADLGAQMFMGAIGTTVILFGALAGYAYTSKRDFSGLGAFLMVALLGLILLSVIGIFFIQAEIFHVALAYAGVLIFSGFVLYDISIIKRGDLGDKNVPYMTLMLYLNVINLLLDILRIFGFWVGDD